MSLTFILEMLPALIRGLKITLALWLVSGVFGLVLALEVGSARGSSNLVLRAGSAGFVAVIRATPLLLQIYIIYYGLGTLLAQFPAVRHSLFWPVLREGFWYAAVALTTSMAAYGGEVLRGGIMTVPAGEVEAGRALGLKPWMVWRLLILPRALRICLPPLICQLINLLKSTALASTIIVMDLLGSANYIRMQSFRVYEPLLAVAVVYVALTMLLSRLGPEPE